MLTEILITDHGFKTQKWVLKFLFAFSILTQKIGKTTFQDELLPSLWNELSVVKKGCQVNFSKLIYNPFQTFCGLILPL